MFSLIFFWRGKGWGCGGVDREREGEREKEKQTSVWEKNIHQLCLDWGLDLQPRHVPWLGITQQPSGLEARAQSTELHQPGLAIIFYSLKVTIRSLKQQLGVALLCKKKIRMSEMPFFAHPRGHTQAPRVSCESCPGIFLQTCFPASGARRCLGGPRILDCRRAAQLNWKCHRFQRRLKQLSLVHQDYGMLVLRATTCLTAS